MAGIGLTNRYPITILKDLPQGYWRLNDPAHSTVGTDSSTNNNPGTYTGSLTLGTPGPDVGDTTSLAMASAKMGYLSIPNSTYLDITGDTLSVECWVRSAGNQNPYAGLVWKENNVASGMGYGISLNSTGSSPSFGICTQTGLVAPNYITASFAWTWDTNWHHIVGVYDGSFIYLYVDGAIESGATVAATGNIVDSATSVLIVGGQVNGAENFIWNGFTAEAAIYNYALTATQIANHYAAHAGTGSNSSGFSNVITSGTAGSPQSGRNTTGSSTVTTTDSGFTLNATIKVSSGSSTVTTTDLGAPALTSHLAGSSVVLTTDIGAMHLLKNTAGSSTVTTTDNGITDVPLPQWGLVRV